MMDTALQPAHRQMGGEPAQAAQVEMLGQFNMRLLTEQLIFSHLPESKDLSHKPAVCQPGYGQSPCQLHSEALGRTGGTMGWGVRARGCPGDGLFVGWGALGWKVHMMGCPWNGVVSGMELSMLLAVCGMECPGMGSPWGSLPIRQFSPTASHTTLLFRGAGSLAPAMGLSHGFPCLGTTLNNSCTRQRRG